MTIEEIEKIASDYLNDRESELDMLGVFAVAKEALEQKLKTGRWIIIEDRSDWYDFSYKCSCCGREIIMPYELKSNLYSDYPYCHCGAKMIELQERSEKE